MKNKYELALELFIEWATDCDFGYDNLGELYEEYEQEIAELSYEEGLKYIALKEVEKGSLRWRIKKNT